MIKERNVYLNMKTLAEARKIILDSFSLKNVLQTEVVPVAESIGRVLAEPVLAKVSSPNFNAAAMDGIAVKAEITFGASQTKPKKLSINHDAFYVNTGHVMPVDTDAVIMIEHINVLGDGRVEIEAPVFPWQHVRKVGEDIVATELLFPQNHVITPYCLGALLAGGVFSVPLKSKPKILIIPTGSEIVDWRQINPRDLQPGQAFETNSYDMFHTFFNAAIQLRKGRFEGRVSEKLCKLFSGVEKPSDRADKAEEVAGFYMISLNDVILRNFLNPGCQDGS